MSANRRDALRTMGSLVLLLGASMLLFAASGRLVGRSAEEAERGTDAFARDAWAAYRAVAADGARAPGGQSTLAAASAAASTKSCGAARRLGRSSQTSR